ncbi:RNA polymerase sigma factor [Terracidiphilus gabretensis]|jgi:RNA polymerase sigma factor (sigma-70 family)|uniref:RNA polymerase sigma factor n=1 Tax=Terracidiphilus gabretensis TaxID=1577687 RepID=UPI00071BEC35|nr:sigma-70 family RNA polymerase sigma factor [Terracidiphilus gabretensis]
MVELEKIIKVHAPMVHRIATVYERYPDRVDDLVQDVWIAIWQALPRLHDQTMLKSYIARITQNICVTHVRRALVRQTHPLTDTLPDPAPPLDEAAAHAVQLARLIEAVRSLPENLKAVASLYLEDMTIKEIALALQISESNVSVRLHRAKAAIRLSFGEPS